MPQPSGTIRSRLFRALGHLRIRARTGRPPRRALRVGLVTAVLATVMVGLAPAGTAAGSTAGNITAFRQSGTTSTVSTSSGTAVRVVFVRADIFRIQLAPDGRFTDPAGSDLTVNTAFGTPTVTATDRGSYYEIATTAVTLRAYKRPLTFAAYRPDGTLLWQESKPTAWTASRTTQYLGRGPAEQYYGTGLRLGPWALRDQTVPIAVDNTWKPNSNASPAPFYMSSNGYGVLRNTWAPGSYAFTDPVATTENEKRFDAYYFVADSLKGVLGAYTDVTGKPFLAPIWGLELGNADCFNASNPDYTGDHTRARHQTTPTWSGTRRTRGRPTCRPAGSCPTTATAVATPTCGRRCPTWRASASTPGSGRRPG
ncbi:hypothetical protein ACFQ0M_45040 [Kitasatospora aburaviensis]